MEQWGLQQCGTRATKEGCTTVCCAGCFEEASNTGARQSVGDNLSWIKQALLFLNANQNDTAATTDGTG